METPQELEIVASEYPDVTISYTEYDDETVIAVDFGPKTGGLSVDIVDETAIVVVDGQQFEFDVPTQANKVTTNDGILTIRG